MIEYRVKSGPLKITIVAETAYEAALEAVRWWGCRTTGDYLRSLESQLDVRPVEGSRSEQERFATFNLLAESEGQDPENAWNLLLDSTVAHRN